MLNYEEIRAFSESACQTEGYLAPPEGFVATREQVEEAIRAALTHAQEKGNRPTIAGDQQTIAQT